MICITHKESDNNFNSCPSPLESFLNGLENKHSNIFVNTITSQKCLRSLWTIVRVLWSYSTANWEYTVGNIFLFKYKIWQLRSHKASVYNFGKMNLRFTVSNMVHGSKFCSITNHNHCTNFKIPSQISRRVFLFNVLRSDCLKATSDEQVDEVLEFKWIGIFFSFIEKTKKEVQVLILPFHMKLLLLKKLRKT